VVTGAGRISARKIAKLSPRGRQGAVVDMARPRCERVVAANQWSRRGGRTCFTPECLERRRGRRPVRRAGWVVERFGRIDFWFTQRFDLTPAQSSTISEESGTGLSVTAQGAHSIMGKHVGSADGEQAVRTPINLGSTSGFMGRSRAVRPISAAKGRVANLTARHGGANLRRTRSGDASVPNKIGAPVARTVFDPTRRGATTCKRPCSRRKAAKAGCSGRARTPRSSLHYGGQFSSTRVSADGLS